MKKRIFYLVEIALLVLGVILLPLIKPLFPEPQTAYAMLFAGCHVGLILILKIAEIITACDKKGRKKEIIPTVILLLLTAFSLCYGIVLL